MASNSPTTIYLVYVPQDQEAAARVQSFLNDKGFDVLTYEAGSAYNSPLDHRWMDICQYVLIIASNYWEQLPKDLDGHLHFIELFERDRSYRSTYVISLGKLSRDAHKHVVYFGLETLNFTDSDLTKLVSRFEDRLFSNNQPPPNGSPGQDNSHTDEPLKLSSPVSRIMTREVVTCTETQDIADLYWVRHNRHFRHFPVVDIINDEKKLKGIVSLRDLLRHARPDQEVLKYISEKYPKPKNSPPTFITYRQTKVADVMTKGRLITLSEDDTVQTAIGHMIKRYRFNNESHYISALPVLNSEGSLRGILTYIDLLTKYSIFSGIVDDIMIRENLRIVQQDDPLEAALQHMPDVRNLLVVDNNEDMQLVGMISDYEVFKNLHDDYPLAREIPIGLLMNKFLPEGTLPRIRPSTDLRIIVELFKEQATVGAIGVFEEKGEHPAGVVGYVDILTKLLAEPSTKG